MGVDPFNVDLEDLVQKDLKALNEEISMLGFHSASLSIRLITNKINWPRYCGIKIAALMTSSENDVQMRKAKYYEKNLVIDILSSSFDDNKSINYIIKQDEYRLARIRELMAYSFEICYLYGDVFFSDDDKAVALILYPRQKKVTPKTIWLDVRLVLKCIGLSNVSRAMRRETEIKKNHPKVPLSYLWFIGVSPKSQGKGSGTTLLSELISFCKQKGDVICLETSTERNIPWYKKNGFEVYKELNFSYTLFCMKRVP